VKRHACAAFGSSAEVWLSLQMQYDLAEAEKTAGRIAIRRIARRHRTPEEARQ
jgi:plasmid maintenance system antidote protein VapI